MCIQQQPCRYNEYHVHAFHEANWHTGSIILTGLGDAAEVYIAIYSVVQEREIVGVSECTVTAEH